MAVIRINWCHGADQKALAQLIRIYGNDSDKLLHALWGIAARVAIGAGVTPDSFAGGVKHHWDHVAAGLNAMSTKEGEHL